MTAKPVNIFIFFLISVFIGISMQAKEYESPKYTEYTMEIVSAFAKQVKKEYGLDCGGYGGEMPYDVEKIIVKLCAFRRATIEEARILEVELTEKLTQAINAHEKIRPFLREYPFPTSRTQVGIAFYDRKGRRPIDGSVSYASQVKGRIYYGAEDPQNRSLLIDLSDEPYTEARKIVLGKNRKPPTRSKDL